MLMVAASASAAPSSLAMDEQILKVPGFADFIAVDGTSAWVTNRGRVEQWSRDGKLASVPMARPCGTMAIAEGSLWVADCVDRTIIRISLQSAKKTAVIPTGIANPAGELNVVAGAGSIWVASDGKGLVSRIDPTSNSVTASIRVDSETYFLTFGFGSLWAASSKNGTLQRIDPKTNRVTKRTKLGKQPGFLVAGEGAVWVQEQGDGTVARVDPISGTVLGRVKVGKDLLYGDIDTGAGKVWLRTTADQTFVAIDPSSLTILGRYGKASGSGAVRFADTGLWTSAHDDQTLSWWSASQPAKD
jgi:virginiamycin B lyase